MEQFLAYQVQRECSTLLKQTAFLEHLEEKVEADNSKTVRSILLKSDISDDGIWLSSMRDALGSQELFEEFKRAFEIHDDVISDDSLLPLDVPMTDFFEDQSALVRIKSDEMSEINSLDRPVRRRRVTFDHQNGAVEVLGNSNSPTDAGVSLSSIPDLAVPLLKKDRSWSPPRPPTPITRIFPLLPMEPIEKTNYSKVPSSRLASEVEPLDYSDNTFINAPSQDVQDPCSDDLPSPSRFETKLLSTGCNSDPAPISSTTSPSSAMVSPQSARPPTSVALIDRPSEMAQLILNHKDLFSQVDMVLGFDNDEGKKSQWDSLLLASRDRLDDDTWMRAIAETLQDEPALLSQFKDMVGYLGDIDYDVHAPQDYGLSKERAPMTTLGQRNVKEAINSNETMFETFSGETIHMDDAISEATTLQGGPPSLHEIGSSASCTDTVDTSTVTTLSSCYTAREELPALMPTIEMLYAVRKGLADERVFGKILPRYVLTKHKRRASVTSLSESPMSLHESPSILISQLLDEVVGPNNPAFKRFAHFIEEGGMAAFDSVSA